MAEVAQTCLIIRAASSRDTLYEAQNIGLELADAGNISAWAAVDADGIQGTGYLEPISPENVCH